MKKGSILLVIVFIVLIIILLAVVWVIVGRKGNPSGTSSSTTSTQPVFLYNLASTTVPLGIPSDLPIGKDAQVVFNGSIPNASSSSGTSAQESTKGYFTSEALNQVYNDYMKYFQGSSWKIVSGLNQSTIKSIDAQNKYFVQDVVVTISQAGTSTKTMVNIIATYTPVVIDGMQMLGPKQNQ